MFVVSTTGRYRLPWTHAISSSTFVAIVDDRRRRQEILGDRTGHQRFALAGKKTIADNRRRALPDFCQISGICSWIRGSAMGNQAGSEVIEPPVVPDRLVRAQCRGEHFCGMWGIPSGRELEWQEGAPCAQARGGLSSISQVQKAVRGTSPASSAQPFQPL